MLESYGLKPIYSCTFHQNIAGLIANSKRPGESVQQLDIAETRVRYRSGSTRNAKLSLVNLAPVLALSQKERAELIALRRENDQIALERDILLFEFQCEALQRQG
jgi:hypothetical protein